jgi:transglutaminase-like putative cysteine protease
MHIRIGFDIIYACPHATPMVLMLNVHPSRQHDLVTQDNLRTEPYTTLSTYIDRMGNLCTRLIAPPGDTRLMTDAIIRDSGLPDEVNLNAREIPVQQLPSDVLIYLLGSRYCETQHFMNLAWSLFGNAPSGWARVKAILDFVHNHIKFSYQHARPTKTAYEVYNERIGVCRDFAHLTITMLRCMNIPARYATGYLGDIGVPVDPAPMDFSAWVEVFLDGRWYTVDARHNKQRIGRIVMAYGRDAADVALTTSFGQSILTQFIVKTDEISDAEAASLAGQTIAA